MLMKAMHVDKVGASKSTSWHNVAWHNEVVPCLAHIPEGLVLLMTAMHADKVGSAIFLLGPMTHGILACAYCQHTL